MCLMCNIKEWMDATEALTQALEKFSKTSDSDVLVLVSDVVVKTDEKIERVRGNRSGHSIVTSKDFGFLMESVCTDVLERIKKLEGSEV